MADLLAKRFNNAEITEMAVFLAKNSFDQKIADLKLELQKFGDDLYEIHFAEHLEQINLVPEGWLETRNSLDISFVNGESDHWVNIPNFKETDYKGRETGRMENSSRQCASLSLTKYKPFPYSLRYKNYRLDVKTDDFKKYIQLKTDIADTQKAKFDFKNDMITLFKKLGSFKKLYEFWPEVRELVNKFEPKELPAPMLPTAPLNEYNKLLGIPTEKTITATA